MLRGFWCEILLTNGFSHRCYIQSSRVGEIMSEEHVLNGDLNLFDVKIDLHWTLA